MRPTLTPARRRRRRAALDQLREERLESVTALTDRLLFDLARLIAGHAVDLDGYVSRRLTAEIRESMRPLLEAGSVIRPDFGPYAELRVEGDLLNADAPVDISVQFEDRSTRENADGTLQASPRRRIHIQFRIADGGKRVVGLTLRTASGEA